MDHYFSSFSFLNICKPARNITVCPDQLVYSYSPGNALDPNKRSYINVDYGFNSSRNFTTNLPKGNRIALILESPHVGDYKNGKAIGPLVNSWDAFCKFFDSELIKKNVLGKAKHYQLIFINAVPHQCSQGYSLNKRANISFKNCNVLSSRYSGFESELFDRLRALKPYLVINLCISFLRTNINEHLKNYGFKYISGKHPSSWERLKAKDSDCSLFY